MGKTYRNVQGSIVDFWPDNDENTLYLPTDAQDYELNSFFDEITNHFGTDIKMNELRISAEYIHTSCITYDQYESGDYTVFIVIRKV